MTNLHAIYYLCKVKRCLMWLTRSVDLVQQVHDWTGYQYMVRLSDRLFQATPRLSLKSHLIVYNWPMQWQLSMWHCGEMWWLSHNKSVVYLTVNEAMHTRKNSKIWDTSNNCQNCPKNRKVWCNIALMRPKDADEVANSVDPDQTASSEAVWSWSALFAETYLSQYIEFVR